MLIELKSKQGFEKNPFKSNLDPIFRCQYHLYMPIFLWKWNPVFFHRPVCLCLDAVFAH